MLVGAIVAVLGVVVAAVTVVVGVVELRMEEGMRVRVEEANGFGVVIVAVAETIEEVELTADAVETTDALPGDGAPAAGDEGRRDGPLVVTLDIEDDICGGRVDVFNVETIETGLELLE